MVIIGTLTYTPGTGWSVADSLYVAVATLTTSSVLDPKQVEEEKAAAKAEQAEGAGSGNAA